jgi:hypothetical protein
MGVFQMNSNAIARVTTHWWYLLVIVVSTPFSLAQGNKPGGKPNALDNVLDDFSLKVFSRKKWLKMNLIVEKLSPGRVFFLMADTSIPAVGSFRAEWGMYLIANLLIWARSSKKEGGSS